MPEMRLDHVALPARNEAVAKRQKLLRILEPTQAERIIWGEGREGGDTMPWLNWNLVPPEYARGILVEVFPALPDRGRSVAPRRGRSSVACSPKR